MSLQLWRNHFGENIGSISEQPCTLKSKLFCIRNEYDTANFSVVSIRQHKLKIMNSK